MFGVVVLLITCLLFSLLVYIVLFTIVVLFPCLFFFLGFCPYHYLCTSLAVVSVSLSLAMVLVLVVMVMIIEGVWFWRA